MSAEAVQKSVGRPRLLDPLTRSKLLGALEVGAPIRDACAAAGISHQTYYRELDRARAEGDAETVEFLRQCEQARGALGVRLLGSVIAAAENSGEWRAAAWMWEKLFGRDEGMTPEEIGRRFLEPLDLALEQHCEWLQRHVDALRTAADPASLAAARDALCSAWTGATQARVAIRARAVELMEASER